MFSSFADKGFLVEFSNGYKVSVMFGSGNYCDNYAKHRGSTVEVWSKIESKNAEIAIFKDGEYVEFPGFDEVIGYVTPEFVLGVMNWAALQPN